MRLISFLILLLSLPSVSAPLECQIKLNLDQILNSKVTSAANQKLVIGRSNGIEAFVTEKENHVFLVEAFIADNELRIYSEGLLQNAGDHLSASLWGRDHQIEVSCLQLAP